MKKYYLMSPGPTTIPQEVNLAEAQAIIHHRTPQYEIIFNEVTGGLKHLFCTENDLFTFASSGTGAMEAAVVNLLSEGDTALVIRGGKFGERWGEICNTYKINVIPINVEWGYSVSPAEILSQLKLHPEIKAVFTTLCETSTAVLTDIKSIGEIIQNTEAVLVVDAISGMGVEEFYTDDWGVDVVIVGSQKGLMIPPGLAFASVSKKAWGVVEKSKLPKFYFSFLSAKKLLSKNQTPYTPAVSLVIALAEALKMMKNEGLENIWKRHKILAQATRAGIEGLGLKLFSKSPASGLTALSVPEGIDGEKIVKRFFSDHRITVAEGQDHLKGKICRIAHMGYCGRFDVITALSALEMILANMGYKFEPGEGVGAALKVFIANPD